MTKLSMKLSIIAAMDDHRLIGRQNQLPWHLPADLKHFKMLTLGKSVIMGRKTYESIGKPLPNRNNIIISRNPKFQAAGCTVETSLTQALINLNTADEIMIIGGASLFQEALAIVQHMYLTFIHHQFSGDVFFPAWNQDEWQEISREDHEPDDKNPYPFSFVVLERT